LNAAYARFFHEYDGAPAVDRQRGAIDPLHNESDYEELLAAITRMQRGRLYYNPLRHRAPKLL
jgi:deoxyguanosine kinase